MGELEMGCQLQQLEEYLNESLPPAQQAALEVHLADCQHCQETLERIAADPEWWTDAVNLLGTGESSHAMLDGDATNAYSHSVLPSPRSEGPDTKRSWSSREIERILDPTDNPEMLGRIGGYEVMGVIGIGGMGAVFKGYDRSLRRVVAIKVLAPHLADSGSARVRFQREARAAAAVAHPNVIDIYGVSDGDGLPYLVMPYARGPSLQQRIDDGGPLSVVEVLSIGRQIAAGLSAAHEQGVVHRDIKPANILLNDGIERLWITDFGVARAMDDASMTRTGLIAGTPQYMSPEQARGDAVDHRSDLFSLGSVLYTACTGRTPFQSEAAYGILRRITDTEPRAIRDVSPDIPDWLCRIVMRLLAKDPDDRYPSAQDVAVLLERCLAHVRQPLETALPETLTRASKTPQRKIKLSPLVRVGGIVMLIASTLAALSLAAIQATTAPQIAGIWKCEKWQRVEFSSVSEAEDWYSGKIFANDGQEGSIQLRWSKFQRRYNGEWRVGDQQFGSITLRPLDDGKVAGALAVAPTARFDDQSARLREFTWVASDEFNVDPRKMQTARSKQHENTSTATEEIEYAEEVEMLVQRERQSGGRTKVKGALVTINEGTGAISSPTGGGDPFELARRMQNNRQQVQLMQRELEAGRIRAKTLRTKATQLEKSLVELDVAQDTSDKRKQEVLQRKSEKAREALMETQLEMETLQTAMRMQVELMEQRKVDAAQATREREFRLRMLDAELEAKAMRLEETAAKLRITEQNAKTGFAPISELREVETAMAAAQSEVEQLRLLIEYYRKANEKAKPTERVRQRR